MTDSVAVIPELSFFEQAQDLANFLSRGIPEGQRSSYLDPITSITSSSSTTSTNENGEEVTTAKELSEEEKEGVVEKVVEGVELGNGGLEGGEREIESYHLLLTSFILASKESESRVGKVVDAITKAASSGKRTDTAARVLSNTYNLLPPSSPLRPKTLFSLLTILLSISDSTITASTTSPISSQFISQSLSQWSLDTSLKVSWLQSVAKLYEANATSNKVYKERALEYRILGLKLAASEGEGDVKALAEEAAVALVGIEGRFELEEVLSVKGVREGLSGEVKELVEVLEGSGVEEGLKWVQAHGDFLSSKGLNGELVERKLRLLALVSLCAGSATKELSYDEISSALKIDEDDVEIWVIDAIHSNLLKASLSQPTKTLRIHSVQSRSFGPSEWKLLSQRLGEWKTVLDDVQKTVSEAIVVSEQSGKEQGRPGQKRGQGQGQGQGLRRKVQEEKTGQEGQAQVQGQGVAA